MGNLVYPASLPGLGFNSTRSPTFTTGVQAALSKKESRIAYQQYLTVEFELQYEVLRDYVTPSDLKALVGLFTACAGQYDTFLYADPVFNTVTAMAFATGDGSTAAFQLTATYQNVGGPGAAELIQNFQSTPSIYVAGTLQTSGTAYTLGTTGIVTFLSGHIPAAGAALTWSGSFYYRCRFKDDSLTVTQFMANFWSAMKVQFQQVKL